MIIMKTLKQQHHHHIPVSQSMNIVGGAGGPSGENDVEVPMAVVYLPENEDA